MVSENKLSKAFRDIQKETSLKMDLADERRLTRRVRDARAGRRKTVNASGARAMVKKARSK